MYFLMMIILIAGGFHGIMGSGVIVICHLWLIQELRLIQKVKTPHILFILLA